VVTRAVEERQATDDPASQARRRVGLAVFVVVVLIIATITLSLLLRRPHHIDGGLSAVTPAGAPAIVAT
jgi:hypothetical protein